MGDPEVVEVYSAANPVEAHAIRNLLEQAGIEARVVGDIIRMAGGELPLGQVTAPRIWVREADVGRAREIVRQYEALRRSGAPEDDATPWTCPQCGEEVEGSFEICWNCQCPRKSV